MVFKKIIFQNRYVALETPLRPHPPFMANTILNLHFDYLIISLRDNLGTTWGLLGNYLDTTLGLHGETLGITWGHHRNHLGTSRKLSGDNLGDTRGILGDYLGTTWGQLGDNLGIVRFPNAHAPGSGYMSVGEPDYLGTAWWVLRNFCTNKWPLTT